MSKKKRSRVSEDPEKVWEAEGGGLEPLEPEDEFEWGAPEQDTPIEEPPPAPAIPAPPPECHSCHRLVEVRYMFAGFELCPVCYNLAAKQNMPRSKW